MALRKTNIEQAMRLDEVEKKLAGFEAAISTEADKLDQAQEVGRPSMGGDTE